ncbi:MAG: NAD(P)/FAD-dependent oxidoreductase [Ignavibacteriales bacterium]
MQYVIIGNSAAAIGCVEGIRKNDNENKIIIISNENYHTYSRPLISYYLEGKVDESQMRYREYDFYTKNNVESRLGTRAVWVDTNTHEVVLENNERIHFDKLLIATGGKPFVPHMEGLGKAGIYTFLDLDSAKALKNACYPGAKAVVVGAGLIGLKVAEALVKLNVEVTVIELANRVLSSILDEKAAGIVQKHLESHGIKFFLNNSVKYLNGDWSVNSVTLNDDYWMECNFVVVAIGVVPNVDILNDTGLQLNRGLVVDSFMKTNIDDIYSAGDVCETLDILSGNKRLIPILPGAYKQGETAGVNMSGGNVEYEGSMAMNSIGLFRLPMITAGIVRPEGEEFEILEEVDVEKSSMRRIVLKDNRIVGYILLNNIDRAGILTNLIKERIDVSEFKNKLLLSDFGYADLPKNYRKEKMLGSKVVNS